MKRVMSWLLPVLALAGCLATGGCVVVPARPAYVAVAPAAVWVPGYWSGRIWISGHWRYH